MLNQDFIWSWNNVALWLWGTSGFVAGSDPSVCWPCVIWTVYEVKSFFRLGVWLKASTDVFHPRHGKKPGWSLTRMGCRIIRVILAGNCQWQQEIVLVSTHIHVSKHTLATHTCLFSVLFMLLATLSPLWRNINSTNKFSSYWIMAHSRGSQHLWKIREPIMNSNTIMNSNK